MTRAAVLMPTRNRARTAIRALSTFLAAHRRSGEGTVARVAIVDDSDEAAESAELLRLLGPVREAWPLVRIDVLRTLRESSASGDGTFGGGPGAARNLGLAHLRASGDRHDVVIMFDDDVVFADEVYRGAFLRCRGDALLREALDLCGTPGAVVGCRYVGRQDLSILEHARLERGSGDRDATLSPSLEREDVEHVAPGGISTAFLAISGSAATIPYMPEHYNEDYVWLHALAARGRRLRRVREPLVHAPPGEVAIDADGLSFQIFGEIVWLAVLEAGSFPVDDARSVAAAIDEIVGDLRSALDQASVRSRPDVADAIASVERRFSRAAGSLMDGRGDQLARDLVASIRAGLRLCDPS